MANIEPHRTLIAPFLLSLFFCEEAIEDFATVDDNQAAYFSAALGKNGGERISSFLDTLGPKISPSGRFALGYTLNIPLLRYFRKVDGRWQLDVDVLRNSLNTIADCDRQAVVYLSANDFTDANEDLVRELAADPENLMWNRVGPMAPDIYFEHLIAP